MRYYCAPMEGVTGYLYRNVHHRYFPGVDKYYTPFLSPGERHICSKRELQEILPTHNKGLNVVPQLLTKRAEDFIWAANELFQMGYEEVNLNLGCPSGTVVAKKKGSGFLAVPEVLDMFLEEIFTQVKGPISVKTRLGIKEVEEFWPLLDIYNRYPIVELTIHPRVQKDFYQHPVRLEGLERMLRESRNPVCYNGDLVTSQDISNLEREFPAIERLMVGRGLIANPALVTRQKGGPGSDKGTLKAFHDALYHSYAEAFNSERNAMLRMKELWFYMGGLFRDSEKLMKQLKKNNDPDEYENLVGQVFQELEVLPESVAPWQKIR